MRRAGNRWLGISWVGVAMAGCGSDPISVDPAVAPFLGTWDAVVFTVTADDPPYTVANILDLGSFWINVQPSGRYQAVLNFGGAQTEYGRMTVQNSTTLTLDPDGAPPPAPSTYLFATPDSLILDGATEFDFNLDGTDESAQVHMEIVHQ